LVLVTSLDDSAHVVVGAYRMRMQIEETFRDLKSHRYGWSAEDIRCRNPKRIDVLLVIAAFAAIASHVVGLAADNARLQRHFQANTVRSRRVFSTFFLGNLLLLRGQDSILSCAALRVAIKRLLHTLAAAALNGCQRARTA
jgi:hypothetical protein